MQKMKKMLSSNIVKNGMWLYILQIFNTVIPLVTLPYITRMLGASQYGIFSSSLNLIGYFQIIVEYGFNLSGARKVAMAEDNNEISNIFSRIVLSKLLLCVIAFLLMVFISMLLSIRGSQFFCMIILYSMVLGTAIQQTWLFQGLQVMKYITIASVISRTISVILIFILVKNSADVYLYCSLYALTFLLMGIISSIMVKYKFNIHLKRITLRNIFSEIKDAWYLFTTSAMAKVFSGISITVLTFTSTDASVGIYSAIQKIPIMLTMIYAPVGQVIYPYISQQYASSFEHGMNKVKKIIKLVVPLVIIVCFIIIAFSNPIVNILYGLEYSTYSNLIIPLAFWLVLSILNNLLGIQILVASGNTKEYSIAFRLGVIAIFLFNILFGTIYGMYGVAVATMLAEFILTTSIIYQIIKLKNNQI